jgi:hypothetical protein
MWKYAYIVTAREAADTKLIRRLRIACWVPKATHQNTEYVTFTAIPLQQLLHGMLYYKYIALIIAY